MPQNHNLYQLFQSRFPNDATKPFLMLEHGSELRYGDVDSLSGQYTAVLKNCDIQKGDRVLVQTAKSPQTIMLYLACLRVGAIYLPLNTAYTAAEVDYFMSDATPKVIVIDPDNYEALAPLAEKHGVSHVMTLDAAGKGTLATAAANATPIDLIEQMEADDLAAILYTSGTTGRSKGAMLSHDNLASNALTLHEIWHWQDNDILLHALPVFHVHGLFVALHCALLGGSSIWFLPKLDIDALIRLLPKSTVLMGVPTFYTRLLDDERFTRDLCTNMRLFISGSAPLLSETSDQFEECTGLRILERYGMSEAGMITSNPYEGGRIAGTVGFALPGVSLRIADDQGKSVPNGEIGVLEFIGPNLFKGYWQMPEKTSEEHRADGYFITGDMATMDDEGRVSIVGRAKDLIISGGYNVYPKEIEGVIDDIDGVLESAVIGVPHTDFGEAVVAVVVKDGPLDIEAHDIMTSLADSLAKFKQPKEIIFLETLPRNTMGKVQKNQLRNTYKTLFNKE